MSHTNLFHTIFFAAQNPPLVLKIVCLMLQDAGTKQSLSDWFSEKQKCEQYGGRGPKTVVEKQGMEERVKRVSPLYNQTSCWMRLGTPKHIHTEWPQRKIGKIQSLNRMIE